ncbi:MAG: NTP transferase domain-containing protein [Chloroflexi bacterium]|nr:NTP transferase domain-containing protein [Chloroflexota bacterium]
MEAVSAAIMAGGRGERLGVLGHGRAKPILPFAGNNRLIDFVLTNCIRSGVPNIAILVQHEAASIASYVNQGFRRARGWSGDVRLCRGAPGGPREYLGTAHAVYMNLPTLLERDPEAVLVLASDHVYSMDYREMVAYHRERRADVTVGVVQVPPADASRFGIVTTDRQGCVLRFVEKPGTPQGNLASMSVYVFSPSVLAEQLALDVWDPASEHDFGRSILPRMVQTHRVYAFPFQGYWRDVGTVQAYWQAHMDMLQGQLDLPEGLGRPVPWGAPSQRSLVFPGCVVEGRIENSVLFPGVLVAQGALVRDSVVLSDATIEAGSVVARTIVDEGALIGPSSYIGYGLSAEHPSPEDEELTVIGRNAVVPQGAAIGQGCLVHPGVSPDDFVTLVVPRGGEVAARHLQELASQAAS